MLLINQDLSKLRPERHGLLRAGIIPYVKRDGKIYFLMGVDRKTREYSDFGGGVKIDEHALTAGMRECLEELRWIIDFRDLGTIRYAFLERKEKNKQAVCIMFSEIKKKDFFENAHQDFHKRKNVGDEMCDIKWLTEAQMLKYSQINCKYGIIWQKIRFVLNKSGEFNKNFFSCL